MALSIQIWCSFFSENVTSKMEHKYISFGLHKYIHLAWQQNSVFFFFKNPSRFFNSESEGQRNISMLERQITAHLTDTYLITFEMQHISIQHFKRQIVRKRYFMLFIHLVANLGLKK